MVYHKALESNRPSRWQEIIQIREDINKIEAENNTQSQPKNWFFEKLSKVDNLPGKRQRKWRPKLTKLEMESVLQQTPEKSKTWLEKKPIYLVSVQICFGLWSMVTYVH